ncbi:MAG: DUF881 domain-containing protein [Candidatus Limnocylindria bacterium]
MSGPGGSRRPRIARRQWAISIAMALAVVGFVGAAQWNSSLAREAFTTSAQQVLTARALELQADQEELRAQIALEEDVVQEFQEQDPGSQTTLEELNQRVAAANLAVGLTDVTGPGMVVEIADSRREIPPGHRLVDYIVLVDDVRDIVSAMWASGAEAITINRERLVATSSIYGVGASILVNTAFLSPPFRIEAIGPAGLHEAVLAHPAFIGRVGQRIDAFGLEFASEARDELTLRGFVGNTRLSWAVPDEEPT